MVEGQPWFGMSGGKARRFSDAAGPACLRHGRFGLGQGQPAAGFASPFGGGPGGLRPRYITRPLSAKGERHIAVSPERFAAMAASGEFMMDWRSHGLRYGIGKGVETTLAHGGVVLMNGSREYLPEALRLFPDLVPVLVEVDASVLRARRWRGAGAGAGILRSALPGLRCLPNIRTGCSVSIIPVNSRSRTAAFYRMVARLIEEKTDFRQ